MKLSYILAVIAGIVTMPLLSSSQIDYKGFPEWSLHKKDSTEYALYTPLHLQPGKRYPVVLFMHGCCGVDNHASLRNAVDPPVRMWHQFGANKQAIPTYIIAPATARGWKQHFVSLKAVIDDLIANHQGDPQRIYVTGFSMGGEGTFRIIQEYPGYFAAAIPMGMNFSGDSLKVKDMPMWINQGETDFHSRYLRKQVAAIRTLNAGIKDTGSTLVTGIYPRYSNFKNVGHGVQWIAASTQDLTGWAYAVINDGNKAPSVFFTPLDNPMLAVKGKPVNLNIEASDPDGSISKVNVFVNKVLYKSFASAPYSIAFTPAAGDNLVKAIAFDNNGKSSTAITVVKVNIAPQLTAASLPAAFAGSYYSARIKAKGNGTIRYTIQDKSQLPKDLQLYPDGSLKGITVEKGMHKLTIQATDEDNESTSAVYSIMVNAKKPNEVLITNAGTDSTVYMLSKMAIGETPFFNSKDSILSINPEEINFSNIGKYAGLSFIQTDVNDANKTAEQFLHFNVDEDVIVYVAYEKLDKQLTSTIPPWLQAFKKEDGQIVAQYRYFDVYSKSYRKSAVILPGADAAHNGVSSNYFVMIKKR